MSNNLSTFRSNSNYKPFSKYIYLLSLIKLFKVIYFFKSPSPFIFQNDGSGYCDGNQAAVCESENMKTVALMIPQQVTEPLSNPTPDYLDERNDYFDEPCDILANAAYLAGINDGFDGLDLEEITNFVTKIPPICQEPRYTPILYMLEDISPATSQTTVGTSQTQAAQTQSPLTHAEQPANHCNPLQAVGISGFNNIVNCPVPSKSPCES